MNPRPAPLPASRSFPPTAFPFIASPPKFLSIGRRCFPSRIQTDANDATKLAVRLVRGAVLKPGGSQQIVRSQGRILNPDSRAPLAFYEEEVPREGARVTRSYQFARWLDGSTHLWMGRRKQVGRGEGSSGLCFDTVE